MVVLLERDKKRTAHLHKEKDELYHMIYGKMKIILVLLALVLALAITLVSLGIAYAGGVRGIGLLGVVFFLYLRIVTYHVFGIKRYIFFKRYRIFFPCACAFACAG
jgi:sterol desaturase/sphingolipid hydroxylase (fatty acid hydroxylase superfamily)